MANDPIFGLYSGSYNALVSTSIFRATLVGPDRHNRGSGIYDRPFSQAAIS